MEQCCTCEGNCVPGSCSLAVSCVRAYTQLACFPFQRPGRDLHMLSFVPVQITRPHRSSQLGRRGIGVASFVLSLAGGSTARGHNQREERLHATDRLWSSILVKC